MLAALLQDYNYTYESSGAASAAALLILIPFIALGVVYIAGMWKMFQKAGEPGYAAIIPIYNTYVLCRIAGRPSWWFWLFFIPCISPIISIIVFMDIAKAFGKDSGYGLGLIFLPFIFVPMLGFGSAEYLSTGQGGFGAATWGGSPNPYSNPSSAGFGGQQFPGGFAGPQQGQQGGFSSGAWGQQAQPSLPSISGPSGTSSPGAGSPGVPPAQPGAPAAGGPVAGWYADPSGSARLRWWDGTAWTDHTSN